MFRQHGEEYNPINLLTTPPSQLFTTQPTLSRGKCSNSFLCLFPDIFVINFSFKDCFFLGG